MVLKLLPSLNFHSTPPPPIFAQTSVLVCAPALHPTLKYGLELACSKEPGREPARVQEGRGAVHVGEVLMDPEKKG